MKVRKKVFKNWQYSSDFIQEIASPEIKLKWQFELYDEDKSGTFKSHQVMANKPASTLVFLKET